MITSKILKFADDTKRLRKNKGNWDKQQLGGAVAKGGGGGGRGRRGGRGGRGGRVG